MSCILPAGDDGTGSAAGCSAAATWCSRRDQASAGTADPAAARYRGRGERRTDLPADAGRPGPAD